MTFNSKKNMHILNFMEMSSPPKESVQAAEMAKKLEDALKLIEQLKGTQNVVMSPPTTPLSRVVPNKSPASAKAKAAPSPAGSLPSTSSDGSKSQSSESF